MKKQIPYYVQRLVLFAVCYSLSTVSYSLAQNSITPACRISYYEQNHLKGEGAIDDRTIIEASLPLATPQPHCSFIKKATSADTYYFVFYDYSNNLPISDFRKLYLRAIKQSSFNTGTIVSELTTSDIAEDDSSDFGSKIVQFDIPGLSEYVIAPTTTYNHLNNMSYLIAWDGVQLRPIGPDWRNGEVPSNEWNLKRRAPIVDPVVTKCDLDISQTRYCMATVYSDISNASKEEYLIPSNIYQPWPILRSIALFNSTTLQQGENETGEIFSFTNLSNGNVKVKKTFSASTPESGGSLLLNIEYTDKLHIPEKVELTQGENILYQGPSDQDRASGKYSYRYKEGDLSSADNVNFTVEGKIGDTASFSFERPNCDINHDGYVDSQDLGLITQAIGQSVAVDDFRDFSGDGIVGEEDVKGCEQNCNVQGCEVSPLDVYTPPQGPSLSAIEVNQPSIEAGNQLTITISLSQASNNDQVTLSSSSPVITLPLTMTVPTGKTASEITIVAGDVISETTVTLTASYKDSTKTVDVVVKPKPISLSSFSISPTSLQSGAQVSLTATLSRSSMNTETVMLSSNNAAISVPASITIPSGSVSGTKSITTGTVKTDTTVTITASYNGGQQSAQVIVKPKATIITKIIDLIKALLSRIFG